MTTMSSESISVCKLMFERRFQTEFELDTFAQCGCSRALTHIESFSCSQRWTRMTASCMQGKRLKSQCVCVNDAENSIASVVSVDSIGWLMIVTPYIKLCDRSCRQ